MTNLFDPTFFSEDEIFQQRQKLCSNHSGRGTGLLCSQCVEEAEEAPSRDFEKEGLQRSLETERELNSYARKEIKSLRDMVNNRQATIDLLDSRLLKQPVGPPLNTQSPPKAQPKSASVSVLANRVNALSGEKEYLLEKLSTVTNERDTALSECESLRSKLYQANRSVGQLTEENQKLEDAIEKEMLRVQNLREGRKVDWGMEEGSDGK